MRCATILVLPAFIPTPQAELATDVLMTAKTAQPIIVVLPVMRKQITEQWITALIGAFQRQVTMNLMKRLLLFVLQFVLHVLLLRCVQHVQQVVIFRMTLIVTVSVLMDSIPTTKP